MQPIGGHDKITGLVVEELSHVGGLVNLGGSADPLGQSEYPHKHLSRFHAPLAQLHLSNMIRLKFQQSNSKAFN